MVYQYTRTHAHTYRYELHFSVIEAEKIRALPNILALFKFRKTYSTLLNIIIGFLNVLLHPLIFMREGIPFDRVLGSTAVSLSVMPLLYDTEEILQSGRHVAGEKRQWH